MQFVHPRERVYEARDIFSATTPSTGYILGGSKPATSASFIKSILSVFVRHGSVLLARMILIIIRSVPKHLFLLYFDGFNSETVR